MARPSVCRWEFQQVENEYIGSTQVAKGISPRGIVKWQKRRPILAPGLHQVRLGKLCSADHGGSRDLASSGPVSRSVWSAWSLLPLWPRSAQTTAGASSTHSIRFATFGASTAIRKTRGEPA